MHYLPMAVQTRCYAGHAASVTVPLFGDFVFVLATAEQVAPAQAMARVAEVLPVADVAEMLCQLQQIELALQISPEVSVCDDDGLGTPIQVESGPFEGVRGVLKGSTSGTLALPLSALDRAVLICVGVAHLRAIGDSQVPLAIGKSKLIEPSTWPVQ
jgi:hypothetical protein